MKLKYFTLDVAKKITETFLKAQWRKVCVTVHPDKGGSHEAYLEAQLEYEMLKSYAGMTFASDNVEDYDSWDLFFANVNPYVKEAFLFAFNDVPNVSEVEICGVWVYVTITFQNKEAREIIKEKEIDGKKFFWGNAKKKWMWALYKPTTRYNMKMDDIRALHGSRRKEKEEEKQLQIA